LEHKQCHPVGDSAGGTESGGFLRFPAAPIFTGASDAHGRAFARWNTPDHG
jgi:hypothetical protein